MGRPTSPSGPHENTHGRRLSFASSAFPLAAELIHLVAVVDDLVKDIRANLPIPSSLTEDQQFPRNLQGLWHQIVTVEVPGLTG